MITTVTLDARKKYLSSTRKAYKTESFVRLTRKTVASDAFITKIAEAAFVNGITVKPGRSIMAETTDKSYTAFFVQGVSADGVDENDLVFYKFLSKHNDSDGTDRQLSDYLSGSQTLTFTFRETSDLPDENDLNKLYLISEATNVNFPLLNAVQRKIVETENANVLVQGVAGSGKTNVCVEKIVYCACRGYRGKILYTTFSRGLLTETKTRSDAFLRSIKDFLVSYENGEVVFLDKNHKKAMENKLGIAFNNDGDEENARSLRRIADFLEKNVDYYLIEDIYAEKFGKARVADERVFLREYVGDVKNYRLSGALEKIKYLSPELVYKEIYGMIFGKHDLDSPKTTLTRDEYAAERKDSFSRAECDVIYTIATDYAAFLDKNGYVDNNVMSRRIVEKTQSPVYSVGIIDEAQDFTQINLFMLKKLCVKMFCVGDALQMINPSYFGFGYVKRLMYGDVTGVSELVHNYRSSPKIEKIAEKLGELNVKRFGTHSFVLKGQAIESDVPSEAVYVSDRNFVKSLEDKRYENVTVIVSSARKKEELRKKLGKTEILTVAESKGLERNAVVLCDVLSDNLDKWNYLYSMSLSRKTADENSVFRYYFNLFYVGISRAKQYLIVAESAPPKFFNEFFDECFDKKDKISATKFLSDVAGKITLDDEELVERIQRFIQLEQYENARYAADRISDDTLMKETINRIDVNEKFIRYGLIKDAGIEYWKRGMERDAKEMFVLSNNEKLIPLLEAVKNKNGVSLDAEIVRFYPDVSDDEAASALILDTLKTEINSIRDTQKAINDTFKAKRSKK